MSAIVVEEKRGCPRLIIVMASSAKWDKRNKRPPPLELRSGEQDKVLEVFKQYGEAPRHEAISRKVTTKAVKQGGQGGDGRAHKEGRGPRGSQ